MAYEWYDSIDSIVYHLEDCINAAASAHSSMLGVAPSAGDEARARLRKNASSKAPLALINEVEDMKLSESAVREASEAIATAAVNAAVDRGSRHITREDVGAAIVETGAYPYVLT